MNEGKHYHMPPRRIKPQWRTMTGPVYFLWMLPLLVWNYFLFNTLEPDMGWVVVALIWCIAYYALTVMRFHAIGVSGWWAIVVTIPAAWIIVALIPSLPEAKENK